MSGERLKLPAAKTLQRLAAAADQMHSYETFDALRASLSSSHRGIEGLVRVGGADRDLAVKLLVGHLLGDIVRHAARLHEHLLEAPLLLPRGSAASVELDRRAVLSLLCGVFVGAVERISRGEYPRVTLSRWLQSDQPHVLAKLRCLLHYFDRAIGAPHGGTLRIERRVLDPIPTASFWADHSAPLARLVVHERGLIEEALGCTQADFANRFIGGGVLGGGCVQEEIRFSVSTELLVSLLLCEAMDDHEAICLYGSEQFSRTSGYGSSLRFEGDLQDPCARAADGSPLTEVVAIDAIHFRGRAPARDQLAEAIMLRETNKAFAGFERTGSDTPIASGNWGCGVFGGNLQVKAIVQWLAASAAGRELRYYTFSDRRLGDLAGFTNAARQRCKTVGELWRAALAAGATGVGDDVYQSVLACMPGGAYR